MACSRRQKLALLTLVAYWPALFVLAHVPIPQVVRDARVSDKSLHVLAYMILAVLLWTAARPNQKVSLRTGSVWAVAIVIGVYAVLDEWLQGCIGGRSRDFQDFCADLIGGAIGLGLLAWLPFWPTLLVVTGSTILTLTVLTRANLTQLVPVANTTFHLMSYGVFALVWMRFLQRWRLRPGQDVRWRVALAGPVGLLALVKISAMLSGKTFEGLDLLSGALGILCAVIAARVYSRRRRWSAPTKRENPIVPGTDDTADPRSEPTATS